MNHSCNFEFNTQYLPWNEGQSCNTLRVLMWFHKKSPYVEYQGLRGVTLGFIMKLLTFHIVTLVELILNFMKCLIHDGVH